MGPLPANGQNMQKFLAVLAVLALAEGMSVRDQWTSFKASHGKKYSVKENTLRFNIWNANRKMVEEHNAGDHEWTMAMYEWSDWTQEEFAERMLGYQAPENLDSIPRKHFDNAAPSHIDFREEGKVTPGWLLHLRRHPRGFLLPALQRWHLQRPSVPVRTAQPRCPRCWLSPWLQLDRQELLGWQLGRAGIHQDEAGRELL